MFFYNMERILNGGGDMKKRFLDLVEKEGFILFLFLCVCAVAGGTIFVSMRNLNTTKENLVDKNLVIIEDQQIRESSLYEIDPSESVLNTTEIVDEKVVEDFSDEVKQVEVEEEELVVLATAEDSHVEGEKEELEFIEEEEDVETGKVVEETRKITLPLEGPIITEYTKDSLIYSDTLESWVGHNAIDIGSKEGTVVVAALDGVVKEVYEDELWGIVIVIDHGNKLETRYSNLGTKEMVKVGINVKKGDHISKIGKSAKIEMLMDPHLHFEVINNGKIVDLRSINN